MSRPVALGLVLLVLILTSQSDWKQETKLETQSNLAESKHQQEPSNREKVKKEVSTSCCGAGWMYFHLSCLQCTYFLRSRGSYMAYRVFNQFKPPRTTPGDEYYVSFLFD